jgi:phosphatidylserine/phosphatidylglycerophosphate/cardiolipin synthase-like enzyme
MLLSARLRENNRQNIFDRTIKIIFFEIFFRDTRKITVQDLLHAIIAANYNVQSAVLNYLKRENANFNYMMQKFTRLYKNASVR